MVPTHSELEILRAKIGTVKHTPAPWVAKRDGIHGNAIRILGPNFQGIAGTGNYIAKMAWTSENADCTDTSPEILANACLIENSPDMFEALEAIQARVNGDYDHPALLKFGPLSHNIQADIALMATRAITKAKGE